MFKRNMDVIPVAGLCGVKVEVEVEVVKNVCPDPHTR
jgi:hypothetical protein